MRIRLLTDTVSNGAYFSAGEECDWPDGDAKRLIATGYAEQISNEQPECMMVADGGSKAVLDRPRPKLRGR